MMANENKDLRFRILAQLVGGDVITKFRNDISATTVAADNMSSKLDSLTTGVKSLAGAYVVREAIQFTRELINQADELDELSEKTGVAVESLAQFKAVAEIEGIALEELAGIFKKLNLAVVEAATGSKDAKAIFKTLGVDFKDGSGEIRDSGSILKDISDKFSKMEDGAAKSALAVKLFGKSGSEFIPFLNKGSSELERFSVAIDADFAARAGMFNDSLTEMSIRTKNFLLSGVKEIIPTLQEIANEVNKGSGDNGTLNKTFRDMGEVFRLTAIAGNSLIASLYTLADVIGTPLAMAAYTLKDIWDGVATTIYDTTRAAAAASKGNFTEAGQIFKDLIAKGKDGLRENFAEQNKLADDFIERLGRRGKAMNDFNRNLLKNSVLFGEGTEGAIKDTKPTNNTRNQAGDLSELAKARTIERDRVKEFIEQQELENKQRRLALGDINLSVLELRKVTEARKLDAEAIRQSKTMTEEQRKALMIATEEIKKQREEIIQQEYDLKRTYVYGAREYLREYLDNVTNNAAQVKQVFQTTFSSLEDTLVAFVKTGKLNFRDFADSVISEIIRISVRQAIIAPIVGALGSAFTPTPDAAGGTTSYSSDYLNMKANGGIVTPYGDLPLKKYASGGIATSPQLTLFGEGRTPEAFVPLPDGRTIPVTMKGEGGSPVSVNVSVSVTKDSSSANAQSDQLTGKNLGILIGNAVKSELINQKRPGGLLA